MSWLSSYFYFTIPIVIFNLIIIIIIYNWLSYVVNMWWHCNTPWLREFQYRLLCPSESGGCAGGGQYRLSVLGPLLSTCYSDHITLHSTHQAAVKQLQHRTRLRTVT